MMRTVTDLEGEPGSFEGVTDGVVQTRVSLDGQNTDELFTFMSVTR